MSPRLRAALRAAFVVFGTIALTAAGTLAPAHAATAVAASTIDGWEETGSSNVSSLTGGQGVATREDGTTLYRGVGSIPSSVRDQGWTHVGDPDIANGHVFDAYEDQDAATAKMFRVTTPQGASYNYVHPLEPGEKYNNAFAAVSPDAQWLVSGEWGDTDRLLVFPAPVLNPATPATGGNLDRAAQITLDRRIRDIQGCDFVTATRLLCASDDHNTDLWPDQLPLQQVDLARPLDGAEVTGLGPLPQRSSCSGTFETEGIDYHPASRTLRAQVIQPGICILSTTVYRYQPAAQAALGTAAVPRKAAAAHNPVVFVHGYNADPGVWGQLKDDLKAAGYTDSELFAWGYDSSQSVNEVLAGQFASYVDSVRQQTGAAQVDVVTHSFGSLTGRWYVKFGGGQATVRSLVSLGGPNHGTSTAYLCAWDQACRDMTPNSYVQTQLASGDETPGAVRYATFWSSCDEVINPDDSVQLNGATNVAVGCLDHNDLLFDDGVSAGVRSFLAG
ncbi:esterase/lipase family protein [Streptomyces formicae]